MSIDETSASQHPSTDELAPVENFEADANAATDSTATEEDALGKHVAEARAALEQKDETAENEAVEPQAPAPAEHPEPKHKKKLDMFSYTQNREYSWLQFNKRVLEEALDTTVPLYERLKFAAIFTSNLDEFFMVRVGSLYDLEQIMPDDIDSKSGLTPAQQIKLILKTTHPLIKERDEIYFNLLDGLKAYGIHEVDLEKASKEERKFARDYFRAYARPILSPQVVDERHPFPHVRNKALYIACTLIDEDDNRMLGLVGIPKSLPRILCDPEEPTHFVTMEKIILRYLPKIFDIYKVDDACVISVTRNADVDFDEEKFDENDIDYRMHVARLLKKRNRLAPVRLEVQGTGHEPALGLILPYLGLDDAQVFVSRCPIDLSGVYEFEDKLTPELKTALSYPPFTPRASQVFEKDRPIIEQVEEHDRILFYPYDSMDPFLRMLREAAVDPQVVSIKMTVYRLARNSRIATSLCDAAENGKDVTVLMELRARFDEENNIDWSERLEESGCHIIYGIDYYKCHSKICLITRREEGRMVNITQIGTGNYNEKTARIYTDLCLFTADDRIGRDGVTFFQNMLIGNLNGAYETLLVAPANMKRTLLALMDKEIAKGRTGRIVMKANSLTERDIIDKLVEASQAGVRVDLNLRGICCLRPGIKGVTDNIRVRSIVGQFLEHSRIYAFGNGESRQVYIASADLMTRNLDHRVEIACHILDEDIKQDIFLFLDKIFKDNTKARAIVSDGTYQHIQREPGEESFNAQQWFTENPLQDIDRLHESIAIKKAEEAAKLQVKTGAKKPAAQPSKAKSTSSGIGGFFSRLFGKK